jgi:hypothetical protein
MLLFHAVKTDQIFRRDCPLYVGNFFRISGTWWNKRKQRQDLILSIAIAWYHCIQQNSAAPGFINEEVLLTNLTRQVKDAKVILEHFFTITRLGFNFNNGLKSPTLISPKKLNMDMIEAIEAIIHEVRFSPGIKPLGDYTISQVQVDKKAQTHVRAELKRTNREDLLPAINWLFKHDGPIDFYFEKSGILQARDKSVWPIKSIECWPGWLRTALFGDVIDIENSYCQFLITHLEEKYKDNQKSLEMLYPDILRADREKVAFRWELCHLLKLEPTSDNINVVKKLVMALANGSTISPRMMVSGAGYSEAVNIILQANSQLLPSELLNIGKRLASITRQFKAAKRDLCIHLLKLPPTAKNQKQIFKLYFDWERVSRYAIWNAIGQTGLMLHDGLDGIKSDMEPQQLVDHVLLITGVRVSVDQAPSYMEA